MSVCWPLCQSAGVSAGLCLLCTMYHVPFSRSGLCAGLCLPAGLSASLPAFLSVSVCLLASLPVCRRFCRSLSACWPLCQSAGVSAGFCLPAGLSAVLLACCVCLGLPGDSRLPFSLSACARSFVVGGHIATSPLICAASIFSLACLFSCPVLTLVVHVDILMFAVVRCCFFCCCL